METFVTDVVLLRKAMVDKGIHKICDLASTTGVSRATLGNVICGKAQPSAAVMRKLINTLDLAPDTAARLGVSLVTLDAERTSVHLAYIQRKPGGKVWLTESALEEYLARATHQARPEMKAIRSVYRQRRV